MPVIRCNYCGNREIDPKFLNPRSRYARKVDKFYCSEDCYYLDNVGLNIRTTIFAFILLTPLIPVWIVSLRYAIRGIKLRRKADYTKRKKTKLCFYCQSEIAEIPEGKGVCMSCGEIIHFCDLCKMHIFSGDEILQLEPCGHIFHKGELLDWVDNNKVCPKCAAEVDFVDLEPE